MAKKKWKFTDLSDDDIVQENSNSENINVNASRNNIILEKKQDIEKNQFDLNMNDFLDKKENKDVISEKEKNNAVIEKEVKNNNLIEKQNIKKSVLLDSSFNDKKNEFNAEELKEKIFEEKYESKYDINIDYDSDVPIKQQIKEQQKSNNLGSSQTKMKTFNETINSNTEIIDQEFNSSKIQKFFTTKEKLDVKTNIYLKPNLVNEIQLLVKKTGESRSAIINKLIEHALKDIKSS